MHEIQKKRTAEANSGSEVTSVLKTLPQSHLLFKKGNRESVGLGEKSTSYGEIYL